jgi:hypothetical protein
MKGALVSAPFIAAEGQVVAPDQVGSCVAPSTGSGDWSGKYFL